jgi:hypothetical protein
MNPVRDHDGKPALPELSIAEETHLVELLQNAWTPREIDRARHERLLQAALEDPFAAASAEELKESERLRQALDGHGDHDDVRLARALSAAFAPSLEQRLPEPELVGEPRSRRRGQVIFYRFAGIATALAVAAAVLFRIVPHRSAAPEPDLASLALAQSRSTAVLFRAESPGAPSERIDRIASARSRDLRDNRYALWGVR